MPLLNICPTSNRGATGVGKPKLVGNIDFFQNSVFFNEVKVPQTCAKTSTKKGNK